MSESSQPREPRPLIPAQVASWLGLVAFLAAAAVVVGYAYFATRPSTNTDADRRAAQKALRAKTETEGQALLAGAARNADGTFRVPVETAMSVIAADPKALASFKPAPAAPVTASAPAATELENGLMKMGPPASAMANGCCAPVINTPGRKTVIHNLPPSILVVEVPGAANTRTSNRVPATAPGGIIPSIITAETSSVSSKRAFDPFGESTGSNCFRCPISLSNNARTSTGMARLPVPLRPTTSP